MSRLLVIIIGAVFLAVWIVAMLSLAQSPEQDPGLSLSQPPARVQDRFPPWTPPIKDGGWRLVASRTTSTAWLYSTRTGRVYQVLAECPKWNPDGCLIPLPVVYGPHRSDESPTHGDDY